MKTSAYKTSLREAILYFLMEKSHPVSSASLYQVAIERVYKITLPENISVTQLRHLHDSKRVSI